MKKLLCLLLCILLLCGCSAPAATTTPTEDNSPNTDVKQTIDYHFMTSQGQIISPGEDYSTKWGDSCLVVFPNGQTMLIDTGMKNLYPTLKARLLDLGVTKLDYVVLTHPHNDHCGGIWGGLFMDFPVGQVYHNGQRNPNWDKSHELVNIEDACRASNIPCQALEAGDEMHFGDVSMKVLWPTKEAISAFGAPEKAASINNLSLVMRFDYGCHSSLFTGDLYKTYKGVEDEGAQQVSGCLGSEQQLVELYGNGELDVDLLKLPHHGDPSTSNSAAFLTATSPEMAVATGFLPVGTYLSVYSKRGYHNPTFFDRQNGYVHIFATADGIMTANPERTDYLENFGKNWNKELERKN